jgi:hypothetical protein
MPDLVTSDESSYSSACVFYNDSSINLFKSVSKYIDSTLIPAGDSTGIIIKSVPVIEYSYFKNNTAQIYKTLENFQNLLEGNMNRLESGLDIDIKFFNTHRPSKLLYTGIVQDNLTGVQKYKYLDRLDIDLNLNIYLNKATTNDIKDAISSDLSAYIESLNKKGIIAMSNIIRHLEDKFEVISFIEINSINGEFYQKIVNIEFDKGSVDDINGFEFVPEFVNVRKGLSTTSDSDTEEKKYKYSLTINYK